MAVNGDKNRKYIPDIEDVKEIQGYFDGDLNNYGGEWSAKKDLDTYLCALAYGCIGKEMFYDAKVNYNLDPEELRNKDFMQGMLSYSVLTKVHQAKRMLESSEFEKTKTLNFKQFEDNHDYATMAFIIYYARTNGYKVEWGKIDHAYTPLNFSYSSNVSFVNGDKVEHEDLFANVLESINVKTL